MHPQCPLTLHRCNKHQHRFPLDLSPICPYPLMRKSFAFPDGQKIYPNRAASIFAFALFPIHLVFSTAAGFCSFYCECTQREGDVRQLEFFATIFNFPNLDLLVSCCNPFLFINVLSRQFASSLFFMPSIFCQMCIQGSPRGTRLRGISFSLYSNGQNLNIKQGVDCCFPSTGFFFLNHSITAICKWI
jgi:hypothetical protein